MHIAAKLYGLEGHTVANYSDIIPIGSIIVHDSSSFLESYKVI